MFNFIKKKQVWIPVVAILVLAILVSLFRSPDDDREPIDFSEVIAAARRGDVERIEVRAAALRVTMTDGAGYRSRMTKGTDITAALAAEGVVLGGPDGLSLAFCEPSALGPWIGLAFYVALFAMVGYFVIRFAVAEGVRRARRHEQPE